MCILLPKKNTEAMESVWKRQGNRECKYYYILCINSKFTLECIYSWIYTVYEGSTKKFRAQSVPVIGVPLNYCALFGPKADKRALDLV